MAVGSGDKVRMILACFFPSSWSSNSNSSTSSGRNGEPLYGLNQIRGNQSPFWNSLEAFLAFWGLNMVELGYDEERDRLMSNV